MCPLLEAKNHSLFCFLFLFFSKRDEYMRVKMQFMLPNCDACIILFIYFDRKNLRMCVNIHICMYNRIIWQVCMYLSQNQPLPTAHIHIYTVTCHPTSHRCGVKDIHRIWIRSQQFVTLNPSKNVTLQNPSHHLHDKF